MKINEIEIEDHGTDMVIVDSEGGEFEPETFACWRQYAIPNTFALDIGSYNGIYAIDAALRGCDAHIFEPNPHNMFWCKQNVLINPVKTNRVFFHAYAASDSGGAVVPFSIKTHLPTTSESRIGVVEGPQWAQIYVTTIKIDGVPLGDVSAVKIDVEGHELQVLKGMSRTINRDRPAIILESLTVEHENEIRTYLEQFKYRLAKRMDGRNLLFLG